MDVSTIAHKLGQIEEKLDRVLDEKRDTEKSVVSAHKRIDAVEKWMARAGGAMTVWAVVFGVFIAWVKKHFG